MDTITRTLPVAKAALVDILEREKESIAVKRVDGDRKVVSLAFRGFQVVSVKLWLGEDASEQSDDNTCGGVEEASLQTAPPPTQMARTQMPVPVVTPSNSRVSSECATKTKQTCVLS
jgi:hypothetical protein